MKPTTCHPDGCAKLCTERGMAAAHAAYHTRLLARARRIVVDPGLAEDVVQEAFLRAWRACASFDPAGGPLINWLLVITGNTAIGDRQRRLRLPGGGQGVRVVLSGAQAGPAPTGPVSPARPWPPGTGAGWWWTCGAATPTGNGAG